MARYETGELLVAAMAEQGDTCLLSFSCGKDSIGAWIAIREKFPRIIPFYCYLVPDLEFVEDSLRYYERVMGCHIARLPHPSLYRMLGNLVFQAPENCRAIEAWRPCQFDYAGIYRVLREDYQLSAETHAAVGVRAVDSPYRWRAIQTHGPVNHKDQAFYPIFDWRIDRLEQEIAASGIKLPVDYAIWGRSFDGLDFRFLAGMREHFPRDYQRVLDWFPLAELELKRMEYRRRELGVAA